MADDDKQLCSLCGRESHASKLPQTPEDLQDHIRREGDEYGLLCPGDEADEAQKEFYLLQRQSAQKIADTDWEEFAEKAQEAYEGRERSDGRTKAQLPETAKVSTTLQEDCDTHVAEIKPTQPWLNINSGSADDVVRAQLEADEAAEAADSNIDIQDRHLTVPGPIPVDKSILSVKDRVKEKRHQRADDAMLYLDPSVDGKFTS